MALTIGITPQELIAVLEQIGPCMSFATVNDALGFLKDVLNVRDITRK